LVSALRVNSGTAKAITNRTWVCAGPNVRHCDLY
jgi:hypothetical protein